MQSEDSNASSVPKRHRRWARADVESARVAANREFFDNFDEIVENDAV